MKRPISGYVTPGARVVISPLDAINLAPPVEATADVNGAFLAQIQAPPVGQAFRYRVQVGAQPAVIITVAHEPGRIHLNDQPLRPDR